MVETAAKSTYTPGFLFLLISLFFLPLFLPTLDFFFLYHALYKADYAGYQLDENLLVFYLYVM